MIMCKQDFTVEIYFRQYWRDERLMFNDNQTLCISNEMLEKIWWPDTFFANAKKTEFHYATTKNAFIRIDPSGEITFSLRLTKKLRLNTYKKLYQWEQYFIVIIAC